MGRDGEIALFEGMLTDLDGRGIGGIVEVAGEPGIGKSRLLGEAGARATARGHVVLGGRAADLAHELPFGLFVDALDPYLASLDPQVLFRLGAPVLAELATAFPSLAPLGGDHTPALQAERFRTYRAARTLLEQLGEARPTVLLLDDIHWADPASRELLAHLLAYPPRGPVLVVIALRPAQTGSQLRLALAGAAREGRTRRLELGPLTRADADVLIGADTAGRLRAELYRESGGNPFYLEQLVRGRFTGGRRPLAAVRTGEIVVPSAVQAALAAELNALPAPARALLDAAAVAGDPFESDLAAEVAEVADSEALDLIDALVKSDVIRQTPVPRRFRFRHPLLRRAVYESAGPGWRVGAHARAAAALAAAGAAAPARAHHVERSARTGDEEAIAVLVEAGHATAPRAPATAGHWYGAATRLLADDDPRRVELLVARASSLAAAGDLEDSHATVLEALGSVPVEAGGLRVALTAFAAGVEMMMGRIGSARDRLLAAVAGLADEESIEAAALKVELCVLAFYSSDFTQMRAWATQAVAVSRRSSNQPIEVVATALEAYAVASLAEPGAEAVVRQAGELMDSLDDACLAQRIDAAIYLAWADALVERFADSLRHVERGVAVARATGQGVFITPLALGQAVVLVLAGRLTEMTELTTAAIEASRLGTSSFVQAWALLAHSWASTYAGELDEALVAGRAAWELLQDKEQTVLGVAAAMFLGMALLESGDAAGARRLLLEAVAGPRIPRYGMNLFYEGLTCAELALGDVEAAARWASTSEEVANQGGLQLETAIAGRARARVLLAAAQPGAAAEIALGAAGRAEASGAALEAARARVIAGLALAKTGNRERAITELEAAERVLSACGAPGFAGQAGAALRRLGRRPLARHGEPGAVSSLSEREREIADLVATGLSNRQIAARCFLSTKTVERHLTNIFVKLDAPNRAALAGILVAHRHKRSDEAEPTG